MSKKYDITLSIKRYDPDIQKSWVQDYQIKAGGIMRFVDLFRKINDEQDPTLAWSSSCEHGQCGSCGMRINGKPLLTCELIVEKAIQEFRTNTFIVEPLTVAPTIRDLVINLEEAYEKIYLIKPYIIQPAPQPAKGKEHKILPSVLENYVNATRCVQCFCCATACCITKEEYLGPNAIIAGLVRIMDPREMAKQERKDILDSKQGAPMCRQSKGCDYVCPKGIDISYFIKLFQEGKIK